MTEKPRNEEEIFNKNIRRLMIAHIAYLAFGILIGGIFVLEAFNPALSESELNMVMAPTRTITISILMVIEIITALSIRRPNIPLWKSFKRRDMGPFCIFMMEVALGGLFFCIYFPFMRNLFLLAPLTAIDWSFVFVVSLPSIFVLELVKWYIREKKKQVF